MKSLLFIVCLVAAGTDILWRRIPNFWLAGWFLAGILLAGSGKLPISGMNMPVPPEEIVSCSAQTVRILGYLGRAAAVFLVLYFPWRLRMTGAGDVKLCSLMAAFMGIGAFARCALYSLFLGGTVSFFYMVFTCSFWNRLFFFLSWFRQCLSCGRWLPYRKRQDMKGTIPFAPVLLAGYSLWWFLKY